MRNLKELKICLSAYKLKFNVAKFINIEKLDLDTNKIEDSQIKQIFTELGSLKKLEVLNFNFTNIEEVVLGTANFDSFIQNSSVKSLSLGIYTYINKNAFIIPDFTKINTLKDFNFSTRFDISDFIFSNPQNLQSFSIEAPFKETKILNKMLEFISKGANLTKVLFFKCPRPYHYSEESLPKLSLNSLLWFEKIINLRELRIEIEIDETMNNTKFLFPEKLEILNLTIGFKTKGYHEKKSNEIVKELFKSLNNLKNLAVLNLNMNDGASSLNSFRPDFDSFLSRDGCVNLQKMDLHIRFNDLDMEEFLNLRLLFSKFKYLWSLTLGFNFRTKEENWRQLSNEIEMISLDYEKEIKKLGVTCRFQSCVFQ